MNKEKMIRISKIFCLLVLALIIFFIPSWAWYDTNFDYRTNITPTHSGSGTLTNFTANITIDTATLISAGKLKSNCMDLMFVQDETTELYYEFSNYDSTDFGCNTGKTQLWVRGNIVDSGSNWIVYYDYAGETSWHNDTALSWDDDYGLVAHFDEMSGSTTYNSLNQTILDGTLEGDAHYNYTNCAGFGGCIHFDGNGDLVQYTDEEAKLNLSSAGTVSLFFNFDKFAPAYSVLLGKYTGNTGYSMLFVNSTVSQVFSSVYQDGFHNTINSGAYGITVGDWYMETFIYDGENLADYLNGTLEGNNTSPSGAMTNSPTGLRIGRSPIDVEDRNMTGYIDEIRISNVVRSDDWIKREYEQGLITFASEETKQVTFISTNMTNGTYFWLNQTFKITPTGTNTYYDCFDRTNYVGNITNNTDTVYRVSYSNIGYNFLNVTCGFGAFNITELHLFQLNDSRVTWVYNTSAYETSIETFSAEIEYNPDYYKYANRTWLFWNDTINLNSTYTAGTNLTFTFDKTLPLIVTNDTSVDFYGKTEWFYHNGTGINTTFSNETQAIYWAYFTDKTYDSPSEILQYQTFNAYYMINRFVTNSVPTFESFFSFNGTANVTGSVHNSTTFTRAFTVGSTVDAVLNWTAYLNITYNSLTVSRNPITNDSIGVYKPNVTLCNISSGISAISFVFQHETERTNVTMDANLMYALFYTGGGVNGSFGVTNTTNFDICIYPNVTIGTFDMNLEYFNTSNALRWYYFENTTIDNTTNQIFLYTLPNTTTTQINITVTDENGDDYGDVIVKLQRLFLEEGSYKFITMVRTDSLGTAIVNIHIPEYYRIILEDGGVVVFDDTIQITESALTIPVVIDIVGDWFLWKRGISWTYNYTEATNTSWFSLNDPSGYMTSVNMLVKKLGVLSSTTICNNDYSGTSMTGFCALGNTSGNVYTVLISGVDSDGNTFLIKAKTHDFTTVAVELSYLFIAIIAVGSLGFGFITQSPEAATLASIIGVALLTFANIIHGIEIAAGFAISGILIIITISRR